MFPFLPLILTLALDVAETSLLDDSWSKCLMRHFCCQEVNAE